LKKKGIGYTIKVKLEEYEHAKKSFYEKAVTSCNAGNPCSFCLDGLWVNASQNCKLQLRTLYRKSLLPLYSNLTMF